MARSYGFRLRPADPLVNRPERAYSETRPGSSRCDDDVANITGVGLGKDVTGTSLKETCIGKRYGGRVGARRQLCLGSVISAAARVYLNNHIQGFIGGDGWKVQMETRIPAKVHCRQRRPR